MKRLINSLLCPSQSLIQTKIDLFILYLDTLHILLLTHTLQPHSTFTSLIQTYFTIITIILSEDESLYHR